MYIYGWLFSTVDQKLRTHDLVHKCAARRMVAWRPGGLVAWWPGGLVALSPGGLVAWWRGGLGGLLTLSPWAWEA